jgi:hypothetical protein
MIKKFLHVISFCLLTQASFAAGNSSSDPAVSDSYSNPQKAAQSFVKAI